MSCPESFGRIKSEMLKLKMTWTGGGALGFLADLIDLYK